MAAFTSSSCSWSESDSFLGARSSKKQDVQIETTATLQRDKEIQRHRGNVWLQQQQRQAVSVIAGRVFKAAWGKDIGCEVKLLF